METWEEWKETEFEEQKKSICLWAWKKYCKVIGSWWLNRRLNKIEKLLSIALEKDLFIYIGVMEVNKDGEQALGGKE